MDRRALRCVALRIVVSCGLGVASVLALALSAGARADVAQALYLNSVVYNYKINHMPDIDQRRNSLPLQGAMYCVPASTFNTFAYAANHGFPGVLPANVNWQSEGYINANLTLALFGIWMSTDPDRQGGGTFGPGMTNGYNQILAQTPLLKRVSKFLSNSYTPSAAKLASYGCNGWAMNFTYGKWKQVDTHNGVPVVTRTGGHAVTLTRAYRDPTQWLIRYRDPADDSANLSTQSTFTNTVRYPWTYVAYYGGTGLSNLRAMNALFSTSGGTRVIDHLFGIRPIFGISFVSSNFTGAGGMVSFLDPIPFLGSEAIERTPITIPSNLEVFDFAFDADFLNALVIAKPNQILGITRLRTLDLSTGELTTLLPAPINLRKFTTDRFNSIYAYTPSTLYQLAEDGTPTASTTAIPTPSDIAVNDADDTIWVLSVEDRQIVQITLDFSETLLTLSVPTSVPMAGDGHIFIHPATGVPWIKTDANDTIYGIQSLSTAAIATPFSSPALAGAESFSIGDDGELFVSGGGTLKVLESTSETTWAVDGDHPFHGLAAGSHIAMLRNSDNFDPVYHEGPEWQNLPESELEENGPFVGDCDADLDANEVVDGADLGLLLNQWGNNVDGPADLNQDGVVDGADLGLMLASWGPCT